MLAAGLLPWSLLILPALRRRTGTSPGTLSVRSLMWITVAATVGFFSIPASKMIGYVLPAVPPLAFLIAEGPGRLWPDATEIPRKLRWFAVAGIVLCLAAVVAGRVTSSDSAKELSHHIAAQHQPGEPIYFLKYQFFDVPFYLRLREPVRIFEDWTQFATVAAAHDDWRNAVFDAGQFDPERAKQLLLERDQLTLTLCSRPVSWVIAKQQVIAASPALSSLTPFYRQRDRVVFRATSDGLMAKGFCAQTPSGGSSGTSTPPPPPG